MNGGAEETNWKKNFIQHNHFMLDKAEVSTPFTHQLRRHSLLHYGIMVYATWTKNLNVLPDGCWF